jgi:hypothetical protein
LSVRRASTNLLSRRFMKKFGALQEAVRELGAQRNEVLRIFVVSRYAAQPAAQREYWREFSWVDQEYRIAVHRLARFCEEHGDGMADTRQPRDAASAPPGRAITLAR